MRIITIILNTFYNLFNSHFLIPKNTHFSVFKIPRIFYNRKEYSWEVKFLSDSFFDLGKNVDRYDISKLTGISFNSANPHINSIRYGFTCINSTIQLYYYAYINGKKKTAMLNHPFINVDSELELRIILKGKIVQLIIVDLNNKKEYINNFDYVLSSFLESGKSKFITYQLFPYFGGEPTKAPSNIRFILKHNHS